MSKSDGGHFGIVPGTKPSLSNLPLEVLPLNRSQIAAVEEVISAERNEAVAKQNPTPQSEATQH